MSLIISNISKPIFQMNSPNIPDDDTQATSSSRNNTGETGVFDVTNDDRIIDDGEKPQIIIYVFRVLTLTFFR